GNFPQTWDRHIVHDGGVRPALRAVHYCESATMWERFLFLCLVAATVLLPLAPAYGLYRVLPTSAGPRSRRNRIKLAAAVVTYMALLVALFATFSLTAWQRTDAHQSDVPAVLLAQHSTPM